MVTPLSMHHLNIQLIWLMILTSIKVLDSKLAPSGSWHFPINSFTWRSWYPKNHSSLWWVFFLPLEWTPSTFPEVFASSPLKSYRNPIGKGSSSNHHFSSILNFGGIYTSGQTPLSVTEQHQRFSPTKSRKLHPYGEPTNLKTKPLKRRFEKIKTSSQTLRFFSGGVSQMLHVWMIYLHEVKHNHIQGEI